MSMLYLYIINMYEQSMLNFGIVKVRCVYSQCYICLLSIIDFVLSVLYLFIVNVILVYCQCYISVLSMLYLCTVNIICELSMLYLYIFKVIFVYCQYYICVLSIRIVGSVRAISGGPKGPHSKLSAGARRRGA